MSKLVLFAVTKDMKKLLNNSIPIVLLSFIQLSFSYSQSFTNSELYGQITGGNGLPFGWENVRANDVNCLASTLNFGDTPDLTYPTGPDTANGVCVDPFSGFTFTSGLLVNSGSNFYHE